MEQRIPSQYPEGKQQGNTTSLKLVSSTSNIRFDEIEKSQSFISKKYDTVISRIKNLKEHNEGEKTHIQEIEEDKEASCCIVIE